MADESEWSWGRAATPAELALVTSAMDQFREIWNSMGNPPFPSAFDGTFTDIRSLDYMQYEGFALPACGIEGAALVCGEVLRRATGLHWVVSPDGEWFIATEPDDWPATVICPQARLKEIHFSRSPQFGRYGLWLLRAVIDYLFVGSEEEKACLLLHQNEEFIEGIEKALALVRKLGRR